MQTTLSKMADPYPFCQIKSGSRPGFTRRHVCPTILIVLLEIVLPRFLTGQEVQKDTTIPGNKAISYTDSLSQRPGFLKSTGKWVDLPLPTRDSLAARKLNNVLSRELNTLLQRIYINQNASKKYPVYNANLTAFDGKIIRNIEIRAVNAFAQSVYDTNYTPGNWIQHAGTVVHRGTKEEIIRKNLLIHAGEKLDVFRAAENERLIRELPYIQDARFLVKQIPGESDSVDLVLLTKDLFPVAFGAEISSPTTGNVGAWYYNIFGYGHQFLTTAYWDTQHTPLIGYRLLYGIPSIGGSFVSSQLEYMHQWNTQTGRFTLSRDFKTMGLKYAGALQLEQSHLTRDLQMIDTILPSVQLKFYNFDLWMGHLLPLRAGKKSSGSGLFFTGRIFRNDNVLGPVISQHLFYAYQNKTQFLASIGYFHQGFRKDHLIYSFDRTEDVPYGYLIEFTGGKEWGEYAVRYYLAGGFSFGKYLTHGNYLFGDAEYGTFVNGSSFEQGVGRLRLTGFTRLHDWGRFQYRNFLDLTFVNGINRNLDEFTTLENKGGIQGLTSNSLRGNEKLVLNFESVFFSPYRLLGFRLAFFGSADLGLIKTNQQDLADATPYSRIGIGIRIRNDQLVFNTFEISFSLYPGIPADAHTSYIRAGTVPGLNMPDLFPKKPAIVPYF